MKRKSNDTKVFMRKSRHIQRRTCKISFLLASWTLRMAAYPPSMVMGATSSLPRRPPTFSETTDITLGVISTSDTPNTNAASFA